MNIEKRLRRLTMLGITDFVTTKDAQALQTDMLRRLERSKIDPGQYASLTDCHSNHCAYKKCLEACWFGTRHRRLQLHCTWNRRHPYIKKMRVDHGAESAIIQRETGTKSSERRTGPSLP